ncbi:transposase [Hymenobacter sp. ASUV-10]|uniref:Transposase n=1 Tax=Hymenobacter aranciens TaxID=3063996 RepID=A0ABT9BDI9_9BACT|nr:transposase [Hymenobacter sp. ASUV-10]MDO7876272.1 transposase [Hymenobacter sp. ASUV-10]
MNLQPGRLYHLYNRGNNRERIFFNEENYRYFLGKMRKHLLPHTQLLAWCLMPNHFHWLLYVREDASVAALGQDLRTMLSSYTRAVQNQQQRTGSLFQQHTQAKELAADIYASNCFCYIHQNPWRASLEAIAGDWPWSSFRDYAGLRNGNLCDRELARELLDLPDNPQELQAFMLQVLPDGIGEQLL